MEGMEHFNKIIKGYRDVNPMLSGVESRTSSPITILRDELLCMNIKGLLYRIPRCHSTTLNPGFWGVVEL